MNKLITTIIAVAIIVGGGAFYGGMKYAESNPPAGGPRGEFSRADLQNLSPEERQQRFQELGASVGGAFGDHESGAFRGDHEGGSRGRFGSADGSRPISGEIISQSDGGFTIKLSNNSTKIVFVSDSTQITKSVDGTIDDLNEGEQIFVSGTENPDGSYTAQTIQLRPLNHN